ncbi:MAG: glutamine--fructose-6-phosphate transaminase (isomerizing) [Clostridia bacterium]|nr:glutamine--fructose-6-phosphate transaminase (isomerizing) [Clostridia bacterium]
MCGIIGYVGKENAVPYLLTGLQKLEYRGYDSAGIALQTSEDFKIIKATGRVSRLKEKLSESTAKSMLGIGHTRWATHGEVSLSNAHPHLSYKGIFTVVHNGIIENYSALRDKLKDEGYPFVSDTDTEVIAHLLERDYNGDLVSSLVNTIKKLEGSFALAILCKKAPDTLILIKKESPLIIGKGKDGFLVASDINALSPFSEETVKLNDGEIALITPNRISFYSPEGNETFHSFRKFSYLSKSAEKGLFSHFMLKEIFEQPKALKDTLQHCFNEKEKLKNELSFILRPHNKAVRIYLIGCGSAYHAALSGKYVFEKLTAIPSEAVIASEFCTADFPVNENCLCIFISQSGETADTLSALKKAKEKGAYILSVLNVSESSAALLSNSVIYTKAGPEIAVATTKAYTCQLMVLYFLAVLSAYENKLLNDGDYQYYINELNSLPEKASGIIERQEEFSKFAKVLSAQTAVHFIGRNTDYVAALEGALKMKEISYIPSDAYPSGELKHGTISLIEKNSLTIALCSNDSVFKKTANSIEEIRSRGGDVITVSSEKHTEDLSALQRKIIVPDTDDLFVSLTEAIPLQLIAFYTAKEKGCDIDKPRNLAKSVTVE